METADGGLDGSALQENDVAHSGVAASSGVGEVSSLSVLVPQAAVSFSPFGSSVYVVEASDSETVARNVYVTVGQTRGDLVEIVSGLNGGEEIVTSGQLKLRDGAPVRINNSVSVSASIAPDPPES